MLNSLDQLQHASLLGKNATDNVSSSQVQVDPNFLKDEQEIYMKVKDALSKHQDPGAGLSFLEGVTAADRVTNHVITPFDWSETI